MMNKAEVARMQREREQNEFVVPEGVAPLTHTNVHRHTREYEFQDLQESMHARRNRIQSAQQL